MALHDIEHGVFADAEPVADFPVRLSVTDPGSVLDLDILYLIYNLLKYFNIF